MGTKAEFISALGGAGVSLGGSTFVAVAATDALTVTAHERTTGEGPLVVSTTGTLPAGLGAIAASTVLTFVANPANTNTATIDGKVYTFQDTLTDVDGHIKIGASAAATLTNLINAMNASGGTPGTDYATANTVHATVGAAEAAGDTALLTAKTAGSAGNAIATVETFTNAGNVFTGATLAGGFDNSYYVVVVDADHFKLAQTYAEAVAASPTVINITDTGSGTHTIKPTATTFAERLEIELREAMANGNRVGLRDVAESRFWDGMLAAL